MRYFYLTLFIFFTLTSYGQVRKDWAVFQKRKLDSLMALIDTTKSDQKRVKALNRVAGYDIITKGTRLRDSSKVYAQRALALAQKIDDKDGIAWASVNLSTAEKNSGNYKESYYHLQTAYENFRLNEDSTGMGHATDLTAVLYEKFNNIEAAISTRKDYLNLLNPKKGIWYAYAVENIGIQYQIKGDLDSSDHYLNIALKEIKEYPVENKRIIGMSNNLGALITYHLVKNALSRKDFDNATRYLNEMGAFQSKVTDQQRFIRFYNIKASYFQHLNQPDSGIFYIDKMLEEAKNTKSRIAITEAYTNSAFFFEKIDRNRKAIDLADSAITYARRYDHAREEKLSREIKLRAYEKLKLYDLALTESKKLAVINDSLLQEENRLSSIDFEIRYEVDKKNQELAFKTERLQLLNASNQANRKVKYWLVVAVGLLVLLIGVVFSRFKIKQKAETRLTEKNTQIEEKNQQINKANQELEKRLLRAQMNPHFVFNSLAAIQGFILENDRESAITYLDKFSKLIRRVLDQTSSVMVPLSEEIKLLEYYIQLESLRFEDHFDHDIVIDSDIDQESTEIPFLLLQPYVENAIQHGFKFKKDKGRLEVNLTREGESVVCSIKDNGVGREEAERLERDKLKDHKSVGMSVSARRLELINKQHKITTSVKITDLFEQEKAIGTLVEIRIPSVKKAA